MIQFIDTNILIAYCFVTDKWHTQCDEIIKQELWLSDKVLDEWHETEDKIYEDHTSAILEHIEYIRENYPDVININQRDRIIDKIPTNIKTFLQKYYLEIASYPIVSENMCNEFEDIVHNNKYIIIQRFKKIECEFNLHKRTHDYPNENTLLKNVVYIHNGKRDRGILLDAHDLSIIKSPQLLTFCTLDGGIYDKRVDILNILNIHEMNNPNPEAAWTTST